MDRAVSEPLMSGDERVARKWNAQSEALSMLMAFRISQKDSPTTALGTICDRMSHRAENRNSK